ncbi:hypothetical protein [Streptomyces sp. 5-10]|uniref:hypothetical protein n=1 Tax=Streptomyces sp. 5-10 TaxID=878925 RepID=UPI00168B5B95|nr:hypothetical protein [Streptomyces sp. 5-10]MBD3004590.1 hypothetical protein [Streptomyces sp. 5-10]
MSLEMARGQVELGARLLDILREVPKDWYHRIPGDRVESPEDVITFLAPHLFGGMYSDVSHILDLLMLTDMEDRGQHGFARTLDEDPAYAATDEELAHAWREEIDRLQKSSQERGGR